MPASRNPRSLSMAQFSGAVKISDLNDFIAPSQACVVSLTGQPVVSVCVAVRFCGVCVVFSFHADASSAALHAQTVAL